MQIWKEERIRIAHLQEALVYQVWISIGKGMRDTEENISMNGSLLECVR